MLVLAKCIGKWKTIFNFACTEQTGERQCEPRLRQMKWTVLHKSHVDIFRPLSTSLVLVCRSQRRRRNVCTTNKSPRFFSPTFACTWVGRFVSSHSTSDSTCHRGMAWCVCYSLQLQYFYISFEYNPISNTIFRLVRISKWIQIECIGT